jgi:hypothetical protein
MLPGKAKGCFPHYFPLSQLGKNRPHPGDVLLAQEHLPVQNYPRLIQYLICAEYGFLLGKIPDGALQTVQSRLHLFFGKSLEQGCAAYDIEIVLQFYPPPVAMATEL